MMQNLDSWVSSIRMDAQLNMVEIRRLCLALFLASQEENESADYDYNLNPQKYLDNIFRRVFPDKNLIVLPDGDAGTEPFDHPLAHPELTFILFGFAAGQMLSRHGVDVIFLSPGQWQ